MNYNKAEKCPYSLTILRRGGVSEDSLKEALLKLGVKDKAEVVSLQHKHHKEESENLEGPG